MTKEQVYNYILVNTNQYFVGSENFEINDKVLDGLIWKALNIWGEYNPVYAIAPIRMDSYQIKLDTITDKFGKTRNVININNIYINDYNKMPCIGAKDAFKVPFQWKYDDVSNILYVSFPDNQIYYVEGLCTPLLDDINPNDTNFLELMVGLALVYIGHNRTDFALSELPFEIRDLRDEGQQIIDKVLEDLKENGTPKWATVIDML
jgi:hypothetical protein